MMAYINKCRVCLLEGAKHPVFESIESKQSIQFRLFQCFKEQIEDIEGYPRNICESCNDLLDTVYNFVIKYQESCKLLESTLQGIKKEVCSDNDSDNDFVKQDLKQLKNEPDSDWLESPDESVWNQPLAKTKNQDTMLSNVKAKLKNLKEIDFKKKPVHTNKTTCKTSSVPSSKNAEFKCNGKSLKQCESKKLSKVKLKQKQNDKKLVLPKLNEKLKEQQNDKKLVLPKPYNPQTTDPPPTLCDICGEICKNPKVLSRHKQKMHYNTNMKCPKCPRTLTSEYNLKRHLKRVHDKKKLFCDHCGRGFIFQGELATHVKVVHLRIIKPTKKHVCGKCKRGYVTVKALTIHERSAHTGFRPASCIECGASFYHEDYLKEHMRLHTGETPFKCPICGRGYAQRGNMRSHMSHNHRLADLSLETVKNLKPMWFKFLKKS